MPGNRLRWRLDRVSHRRGGLTGSAPYDGIVFTNTPTPEGEAS